MRDIPATNGERTHFRTPVARSIEEALPQSATPMCVRMYMYVYVRAYGAL